MSSTPEQLAVVVPVDRPQPTQRGYRALLRILTTADGRAENETEDAA